MTAVNESNICSTVLKHEITPGQQATASCVGALVTSVFMTPLDVVKTRLQAQQRLVNNFFPSSKNLKDCINNAQSNSWTKQQIQISGILDAFVKITRNEGITSFWSGLSPTLVLSVPATICYFVSYEQLRLKLKGVYNSNTTLSEMHTQPFWIPILSASTARAFSVTLVNPLELIKTKMQSKKHTYLELSKALNILIKRDGVKGLWKGIVPTFFRDVPFSAIYWLSYESIKSLWGLDYPPFWQSFISGAVSGSIAATVTIPFDVVKTHQQIAFGANQLNELEPTKRTRTTSMILWNIYRYNGIRGLFVGLAPRLIRVAPACAIMISCFEYGKVFFNKLAHSEDFGN